MLTKRYCSVTLTVLCLKLLDTTIISKSFIYYSCNDWLTPHLRSFSDHENRPECVEKTSESFLFKGFICFMAIYSSFHGHNRSRKCDQIPCQWLNSSSSRVFAESKNIQTVPIKLIV